VRSVGASDDSEIEDLEDRPIPPYAAPGEDPDFPAHVAPGPMDWLAHHEEEGQSAEDYREECTNRITADRRTVVLVPYGDLARTREELLKQVREYVAVFFGVDAEVEASSPLPTGAWDPGRGQCDGGVILRNLENRLPGRALALVGLCEEDLFTEGFQFVFGVAQPSRRCGVWSLDRYHGDGDAMLLRRTLKVATHEIGHLLGMAHCVRYRCLMNGSNHRAEMDATPIHLCPECEAKLLWNSGADRAARWRALEALYVKLGFEEDAAFARRR
jgi:archaemetzincin